MKRNIVASLLAAMLTSGLLVVPAVAQDDGNSWSSREQPAACGQTGQSGWSSTAWTGNEWSGTGWTGDEWSGQPRNMQVQVIDFAQTRTPYGVQNVDLWVRTPDGQARVLDLGHPRFVRVNLPPIRSGEMVMVRGRMIEQNGEPCFQATDLVTEGGTIYPLQEAGFAMEGHPRAGHATGYEYGASNPGAFNATNPSYARQEWQQEDREPTLNPDIGTYHWKDETRGGEYSTEDLERSARFGYSNARNLESDYARHEITGTVHHLEIVSGPRYGGRAVLADVQQRDGQTVKVIFSSPDEVRRMHVHPGSVLWIKGNTELFQGTDTLWASQASVLRPSDNSWSGGQAVARRDRYR